MMQEMALAWTVDCGRSRTGCYCSILDDDDIWLFKRNGVFSMFRAQSDRGIAPPFVRICNRGAIRSSLVLIISDCYYFIL